MDDSLRHGAQRTTGPPGRVLVRRALLAALGGGLLCLIWIGYSQPGLLMDLANLRYCG